MRKKLTMATKIKSIAALLVVFILIIATNLIDSNHFKTVQNSINTVYSDRLVAMDYIYKISRELEQKKLSLINVDKDEMIKVNAQGDDLIEDLIDKYATTELTKKEAQLFQVLQKEINDLKGLETNLLKDGAINENFRLEAEKTLTQFSKISKSLDALAEVQIAEGKREINNSNRAISVSNLISRLEIAALIIIGVLIQMLIFYKPISLTDTSEIHLN